MNRIVCCFALIFVLAATQGLALHTHLPHANDVHAGHDVIHVHSDAVTANSEDTGEHFAETSIDLFISNLARGAGASVQLALITFWIGILMALLVSSRPLSILSPLVHYAQPPYRRSSPRAPPL